jgi:hypothetical protein
VAGGQRSIAIDEHCPPELTQGSLRKNIRHLSWPTFFIMVFNFLVGLADLYVAGFIGPDIQAAIGFVTQLFFIVIVVANAIGVGTIAMVSRAVGASNPGRAVGIARQSLLFGAVVAVVITAATVVYCREIVALAGMPGEIRAVAEDFLRIFAFALGPNYLLFIATPSSRRGRRVKTLLTMFFVSLVNIAATSPGLRDFRLFGNGVPRHRAGHGPSLPQACSSAWRPGDEAVAGCLHRTLARGFPHQRTDRRHRWPSVFLQVAAGGSIVHYNILSRIAWNGHGLAALTNGLRIRPSSS